MQRRVFIKLPALLAAVLPGFRRIVCSTSVQKPAKPRNPLITLGLASSHPGKHPVPTCTPAKFPMCCLLDWDSYQAIQFKAEHALWADEELPFQVRFFHLGWGFKDPCACSKSLMARHSPSITTRTCLNTRTLASRPSACPSDLGFAGFRVQFHTDWISDGPPFGASYFRAVGAENSTALSARPCHRLRSATPEEFLIFKAYLECPKKGIEVLTVYALMDSPSIIGAYRFEIRPGSTLTMDVDAALYPARPLSVWVLPQTSMYQTGENDRRMANDWRPEIHDTDGLAMWAGNGENLWRPLTNPGPCTSTRITTTTRRV